MSEFEPFTKQELDEWVPLEVIKNLTLERDLTSETHEQMAERILSEGTTIAAHAIMHIVKYSPRESMRFKAAQYVIDRQLLSGADGKTNPWDALLADSVGTYDQNEPSTKSNS